MDEASSSSAVSAPDAVKGKKGLTAYILLAVIIAVQLTYTILCFAYKKDGFFGDEIWGYGLANSYYKPFIYLKKDVSIDNAFTTDLDNFYTWTDGGVFERYITVQPNERFAYGSVVYNQSLDHHPPLYYMLLHTVCSFFPDSFSWVYGFVLNCIFLVINSVFLYLLAELMTKSRVKALISTAFYAASTGGLSTFIYIRQYSLFTCMLTVSVYFTARFFYGLRGDVCDGGGGNDGKNAKGGLLKAVLPIAVSCFLTFFTHYYGIMFIGILTAVICLWLLFHKRIKAMLVYGGSVLAALLLFFAVYPASISQALTSADKVGKGAVEMSMPYLTNLKYAFSLLLRYSVGIRVAIMREDWVYYVIMALVLLAGVCVPVGFLVRKEKWFIAFSSGAKNTAVSYVKAIRHADALFIGILLGAAVTVCISCRQVDFFYYNNTGSRYVFHLMPLVCVSAVFLLDKIICLLPKVGRAAAPIIAVLAIIGTVRMNIMWQCPYYFRAAGNNMEVRDHIAGKNVLLVLNSAENTLSNFTSYIGRADKVYVTMRTNLEDDLEAIGAERIDCMIIHGSDYFFTERQYGIIKELFERYGTKLEKGEFAYEGEEDDDATSFGEAAEFSEGISLPNGDGDGKNDPDEDMSEFFAAEKLNGICPKDDFDPSYVIDVNEGKYVVFDRR